MTRYLRINYIRDFRFSYSKIYKGVNGNTIHEVKREMYDERLCVKPLVRAYNVLYKRWVDYYNNTVPGPLYNKVQARKFVVTGLILTTCTRPTLIKEVSVGGGVYTVGDVNKTIQDTLLQGVLAHWSRVLPPDYYRVSDREVRNIVKEILGVSPSVVRLLCLANKACRYGIVTASWYYCTSVTYAMQLLKYLWKKSNFKQIVEQLLTEGG